MLSVWLYISSSTKSNNLQEQLPPKTQTGANSFSAIANGNNYKDSPETSIYIHLPTLKNKTTNHVINCYL